MQEICPRGFVSLFGVAMMKYLWQVNPIMMFTLCIGLEVQGHGAAVAQLWGELWSLLVIAGHVWRAEHLQTGLEIQVQSQAFTAPNPGLCFHIALPRTPF